MFLAKQLPELMERARTHTHTHYSIQDSHLFSILLLLSVFSFRLLFTAMAFSFLLHFCPWHVCSKTLPSTSSMSTVCPWGCLSLADGSDHISPSFHAVSPIDRPGQSLFVRGWCSEQIREEADGSLSRTLGSFCFSFLSCRLSGEYNSSSPCHN